MKVCAGRDYLTRGPDMIVLEHDHAREIMAVRIDSSYKHPVFLDKSKPYTPQVSSSFLKDTTRKYVPGVVFLVPAIIPLYP